jgi:hypothetical protein
MARRNDGRRGLPRAAPVSKPTARPGLQKREARPEKVAAFRVGISAESRAAAFLIAKGFASWRGAGNRRSARSTSSRVGVICWCSSK